MSWYPDFQPSTPIATDKGLKAKSRRGAFAETWWATRWIEALERLMDAGRLRRGKRYARQGQVLSVEEAKGGVRAKVQGSRPRPYTVDIRLAPLEDAQWDAVLDALAGQALFAAQLLSGEMPADIEEAFAAAGVHLFPEAGRDLQADCSCPDWAEVCKHIAATHYILGERFDEDPFLLFRLRGRTQVQILDALRARRGAAAEIPPEEAEPEPPAPPLSEALAAYWQAGPALETCATRVQPPPTPMPALQRLGQPTFLDEDVLALFGPAYEAMTRAALDAGREEEPLEGRGKSD